MFAITQAFCAGSTTDGHHQLAGEVAPCGVAAAGAKMHALHGRHHTAGQNAQGIGFDVVADTHTLNACDIVEQCIVDIGSGIFIGVGQYKPATRPMVVAACGSRWWRQECAEVLGVVGAARWRYEYGLPQPQCLGLGQRNAVVHGIGRSIDPLLCAYVRKRGNGHTS